MASVSEIKKGAAKNCSIKKLNNIVEEMRKKKLQDRKIAEIGEFVGPTF